MSDKREIAEWIIGEVAEDLAAGTGASVAAARERVLRHVTVEEVEEILGRRMETRAAAENVTLQLGGRVRDEEITLAAGRVELEAWLRTSAPAVVDEVYFDVLRRVQAGTAKEMERGTRGLLRRARLKGGRVRHRAMPL